MNSEKLNNTGDRSKSQEIPEETKNDLHNRRTLSLFNAGAGLISQLTVFAADHSINKQSTKQNGLTATDPSNLSSLQSPLENHLVEVEVRAKSASSPKVDFDSPPPQAELIEDGTTENGLKGPQCCSCQVSFEDRNSQVEHYKLDWHRYNLKRSLVGLPSATALEFEETVQRHQSEGGELSSISGSEDEDENDEDEDDVDSEDNRRVKRRNMLPNIEEAAPSPQPFSTPPSPPHHPKLFFRLPDGKVASLYRALLFPKAERSERGGGGGAAETLERAEGGVEKLKEIVNGFADLKTVVILTGGGHFAAAVFQGDQVLEHKTFHRYVVRQKQGGTQSAKDSCGHAPKSAGASLRRYNEAALTKDIKELLGETWSSLMTSCSLVFIRAPSSNRQTFFSGKPPLLSKTDDRVRLIPFVTRRPTFNEVQRVFKVLTSFYIYDVDGDEEILFGKSGFPKSPPKRTTTKTATTVKKKHSTTEGDPTVTSSSTSSELATSNDIPASLASAPDTDDANESPSDEKRERQIAKQNRRLKHLRGQEAPDIERSSSDDESDGDDDDYVEGSLSALSFKMESLDTSGLKQFDCDLGQGSWDEGGAGRGGRRPRKRKTKGKPSENAGNKENETAEEKDDYALLVDRVLASYKNDLLTFCRTTDEEGFARVLDKCRKEIESGICEQGTNDIREAESSLCKNNDASKGRIANLTSRLLNSSIPIGASSQFTSLLHVASQTGSGGGGGGISRKEQIAFVLHLLTLGCDPGKTNGEGKSVYLAADKSIRLALRDFRSKFPDKFDFEAAGIPAPPSAEEAADKAERTAERKKKLREAKKERDKEKKEERLEKEKLRQKAKEAEDDKKRFLALSERDKRALAAEKRLASQTNRCWLCASDMNGLVPFEYLDLKFCSVKCLQEHRKKNSAM